MFLPPSLMRAAAAVDRHVSTAADQLCLTSARQCGTVWGMSEIELAPLSETLDEDAMTEFLDRLEAHDLAADIYVPVEFEGRLQVGDYRVASAQLLVDVLEEMKDELDVEEDKEEYEDDEEEEEEEDEEEEETTV